MLVFLQEVREFKGNSRALTKFHRLDQNVGSRRGLRLLFLVLLASYVGECPVTVLRDSGSNGVVVRRSLVDDAQLTGKTRVRTPIFKGEIDALCLETPVYDLVIGNIKGIHPPCYDGIREPVLIDPGNSETAKVSESATCCVVEPRAQRKAKDQPSKPLDVPTVSGMKISANDFQNKQGEDLSLKKCFDSAEFTKDKPSKDQSSQFVVLNGLLYRLYRKDKGTDTIKQFVVPNTLRNQVTKLGHETLLSGHQGIKKSLDRIHLNFYWPGVIGDVHRFCQWRNICQKTVSRGNIPNAPVQVLPIINTPFEKVAIDVVGP